MDYSALATLLSGIAGQTVFLRTQPDILDFTDKTSFAELIFYCGKQEIKISVTDDSLPIILEMLKLTVFSKGNKILCWDWKSLATYVLGKTNKSFHVDAAIIDLKIIESYLGFKKKVSPTSLLEALNRLKSVMPYWKEIETVYKKVHLPLSTVVLPHLETTAILDKNLNERVYAHYEIDGQDNGRLRCSGVFSHNYVPHAMKPETRQSLLPRSYDELFMLFDFKGMEVFMLACMSQDPLLQELCSTSDVYTSLFEKITNQKSSGKNDRDLAKKFFLPVIYGQSAYGLSHRCGVALDVAENIVDRINSLFPIALKFVESYQLQLGQNGYAKDIFGKRRTFDEGKEYSVRNFSIQAPSAVICLEKLSHLYFALKNKSDIVYTVHDGYVVYATKENWKKIYKIGTEVLRSESELCPGLRLRVACRAGRNLDDLKPLERKGERC